MTNFHEAAKAFNELQSCTLYYVYYHDVVIAVGNTRRQAFAKQKEYQELFKTTDPQNYRVAPQELDHDLDL